jgi:hypothetical protein
MQKSTKNMIAWIVVIVVLVVGGYLLYSSNAKTEEEVIVVEPESVEDVTEGSVNKATGSSMKYTDAVAKYADKRIQLDTTCQARPNNVTFKSGTTIMIDNRSPKTANVRLGSTFSIKPYGFKIMTLSSSKLPATLYIDCGTSQNVATVLIQK